MLIINKLAVHTLPAPSMVLFVQLMSAALSVRLCSLLLAVEVDALEYRKIIGFAPVAFAFLGVIFANIKTLQYANVETFIVFRASTPIVVSIADYLFLGRALPSCRSWLALLGLLLGVVGYVATDKSLEFNGLFWVGIWYVMFCFDQIYIKHAVEKVQMRSNWGRVYYCNLFAALPLFPWACDDFWALSRDEWTANAVTVLIISCVLGCGISYFAFLCRKILSATAFTVVGNCCKIATVVVNCLIWQHHASPEGIAFLVLSLFCALFFKQAPLRSRATFETPALKTESTIGVEQDSDTIEKGGTPIHKY
jgi:solute carrier family 35 protein